MRRGAGGLQRYAGRHTHGAPHQQEHAWQHPALTSRCPALHPALSPRAQTCIWALSNTSTSTTAAPSAPPTRHHRHQRRRHQARLRAVEVLPEQVGDHGLW